MDNTKPFGGISGSTLKLIAIVTMFIDHTGATVLRAIMNHPDIVSDEIWFDFWRNMYSYSRNIGRLAFPIFCFLIVEGFTHTRNVWKYAFRMFLFALISEIPFDIALKGNWYFPAKQNVYFTLLIGLLVLIGLSWISRLCQNFIHKVTDPEESFAQIKAGLLNILPIAGSVLSILAGMNLASRIDTDYNFKGVFLIAALYLVKQYGTSNPGQNKCAADLLKASVEDSSRLYQCLVGTVAVSWELPAPLGFIPVYLYNGTRGLRMKYFFYWFYPVHLLILHVIAEYLIPAL